MTFRENTEGKSKGSGGSRGPFLCLCIPFVIVIQFFRVFLIRITKQNRGLGDGWVAADARTTQQQQQQDLVLAGPRTTRTQG